uniref:Uncharacterized protein n=1 Tax=Roseihalotalea indica TaxID=2867963 RepID=A0AA49JJG2_9BACT|nr:hypothetical protein K4G66_13775 [Tunicatimonas sp. TK19036]
MNSSRLFDLKTLLLLREEVKKKLAEELNIPSIEWNQKYLNILKEKFLAGSSVNTLSDRAIRMNLTDKITDHTEIPRIKDNTSRIDLMCKYLGYEGFEDYQGRNRYKIDATEVDSYATFSIANVNFTAKQENKVTYLVVYHQSYFEAIIVGILKLFHQTGQAEFQIFPPTDYHQGTFEFTGTFEHTPFGYLNFFGSYVELKKDVIVYARIYFDKESLGFKYFTGVFASTSIQNYSCLSGVTIMEKVNNYAEAIEKIEHPVDKKIQRYLHGKRLSTERKAYYSLDDLVGS